MSAQIETTYNRQFVTLTAEADAVSAPLIMEDAYGLASVTVHPGDSGSAILQITCAAPPDFPFPDDPATWFPEGSWVNWSEGAVTSDSGTEINTSISGVRLRAIGAQALARVSLLRRE